jgi:hypothetical protein
VRNLVRAFVTVTRVTPQMSARFLWVRFILTSDRVVPSPLTCPKRRLKMADRHGEETNGDQVLKD